MKAAKVLSSSKQCAVKISSYMTLFIILLFTIHVNQAQITRVVSSQTKYNDYLMAIDLYELISHEMNTYVRNYIVYNNEEDLETYQEIISLGRKREVIEDLYALGITEKERRLVEQVCYLSDQIESLQHQAIFELKSNEEGVGFLNIESYNSQIQVNTPSVVFSESYKDLIQQYNKAVQTLKASIKTRMTSEIKKSTSMLNISFYFMSFFAAFVPTFYSYTLLKLTN